MPTPPVARAGCAAVVAAVALTALAMMLTTQQALADGRELPPVSISMPSLSSVMAWFQDPHWGRLPHQRSGTAESEAKFPHRRRRSWSPYPRRSPMRPRPGYTPSSYRTIRSRRASPASPFVQCRPGTA
ncbi:hypothetical protein [Streptomyces fagopyri]